MLEDFGYVGEFLVRLRDSRSMFGSFAKSLSYENDSNNQNEAEPDR